MRGLRAPLPRAWRPWRLDPAATAVPVIEPQHVLGHLVVRLQLRARATTCRAVPWPSFAELRERLPRPLRPRQAHADAAQPQTEQPARPGHGPCAAWREGGGGHSEGARGRWQSRGLNATPAGERSLGAQGAAGTRQRQSHFLPRPSADQQVGSSRAAARTSQTLGAAGAGGLGRREGAAGRRVCGPGVFGRCLYPPSPLDFREHPAEAAALGTRTSGAPGSVPERGARSGPSGGRSLAVSRDWRRRSGRSEF